MESLHNTKPFCTEIPPELDKKKVRAFALKRLMEYFKAQDTVYLVNVCAELHPKEVFNG